MTFVIVAWAPAGGDAFERGVPLLWSARWLRFLESSAEILVVFLQGLERLPPAYRAALGEVGYRLIDASGITTEVADRHPALGRFGDFERLCFLRWPVLRALLPGERLMHFDADVVFNQPVEVLERDLGAFTFVLQGCPAFAVIDTDWLDVFCGEFGRFALDVEGYSRAANRDAENSAEAPIERWAAERDRELLSSDQDLMSHLIRSGRLPQSDPAAITAASSSLLVENPLYPHVYLASQLPLVYERRGGVDHLSGTPLALWHMQSNFCDYLAMYLSRPPFRRGRRLDNPLIRRGFDYLAARLHARLEPRRHERIALYRAFFERGDFSGVYDPDVFWAAGAFERPAPGR